jgi:DNA-binding MarR family transcriptional regulator
MQRAKRAKGELVAQVIRGAREYSIGMVSLHQEVGRILGLNVTDMKCLDVMTMQGSATPSQLAEQTGLSSGATTAMIDRLERARLVVRRPHPTDRRGTVLVLTQEAMEKLPSLFESLGAAIQALMADYSQKELVVLADFFAKARVLWQREREKLQVRSDDKTW